VRHANVVLKSRARDVEETLVQLVHEDDQVVAAAAIHYVGDRQLRTLTNDIEFALAHRPMTDAYAMEAATWALGSLKGNPRAQSWREPLPAVELAQRVSAIALFDFVSVDELFRIAGRGRQVLHESGRTLYEEGHPPTHVEFLLEGVVEVTGGGGDMHRVAAPAALAFEEVLEGSVMHHTIRVVDGAICLTLGEDEFLTMLSDNVALAQGLFRMLLESPKTQQWRTVFTPRATRDTPHRLPLAPLEKVLLLRHNPLLERATVGQLLDLVTIAREQSLPKGVALFAETDSPAIYVVLDGDVRLDGGPTGPAIAGPGSTIGVPETLAGVPIGRRAVVAREGQALRLDHDDLFDVLGDHVDLLQGLFSGLLRARQASAPAVEAATL